MKVMKPIIHNQVYSEIIFLMGWRKVYSSHFAEEFDFSDGDITGFTERRLKEKLGRKKQSVLFRQLETLRKEGYLSTEKTGNKNKTYYYVLWGKIVEDFLDYTIKYLEKQKPKAKRYLKTVTARIKKLKEKSFRDKAKNNFYVKELFLHSFWEVRQCHESINITIAEIFEYLLQTNVIPHIVDKTCDEVRNDILDKYDKKAKDEATTGREYYELSKKWGDKVDKDYTDIIKKDKDIQFFFDDFRDNVFTNDVHFFDFIFRTGMPIKFAHVLQNPEKKEESEPTITDAYS